MKTNWEKSIFTVGKIASAEKIPILPFCLFTLKLETKKRRSHPDATNDKKLKFEYFLRNLKTDSSR